MQCSSVAMYAVCDQMDTEFSNILLYNVGQPMWIAVKAHSNEINVSMQNSKAQKPHDKNDHHRCSRVIAHFNQLHMCDNLVQ